MGTRKQNYEDLSFTVKMDGVKWFGILLLFVVLVLFLNYGYYLYTNKELICQ